MTKAELEHIQKFDHLAQIVGIRTLMAHLQARWVEMTPERMKTLAEQDIHLNNIPLIKWDRLAGSQYEISYTRPLYLSFDPPWTPSVANGLSLADRVCILKHVARYYYAGLPMETQ